MPALENARHEAFARYLAKGHSQTQAYIKAGYEAKTARFCASRVLSTKANVRSRVQELQERQAVKAVVTADSIIAELEEARVQALASAQNSAAVAASMGKAKIRGLIIDRKENGAPGEFASLDEAGLRAWIAKQIEGTALDRAETALTDDSASSATYTADDSE